MVRIVEAIYSDGVLRPVEDLSLTERQRVRLIVETLDSPPAGERMRAFQHFVDGVQDMDVRLNGRAPSRDELHERP